MKLLENLFVDANNFETSSWDISIIAAESHTALAPDGSLTAYNALKTDSGWGLITRNFSYVDIDGTNKDIEFGVFMRSTGVGSLTAMSLDVRSGNTWNYVTFAWSGDNCEVYSDSGKLRQFIEVHSGWYYASVSRPNSGYASTIRTNLYPSATEFASVGAATFWQPHLLIGGKSIILDAEYDYKDEGAKIESEHRTKSGGRYVYKWGKYDGASFTSKYLSQSDKITVNSWWQGNTELLLLDEYGTKVMSCQILNNKTPFGGRVKPYNNQFQGTIKLGTY